MNYRQKCIEVTKLNIDQNIQQEKLAAMKQLAYGASHEINNPLANIATRAQVLLKDETDDTRRRQLATIYQQAMRAHEMISDMMLFAHPPQPKLEALDLRAVIQTAVDEIKPMADEHQWQIEIAESSPIRLQGDMNLLSASLKAVFQNSIESRTGGKINVKSTHSNGEIELIISDNGHGISDDARRHMFDPFYSGREAGRGLGFGLPKAWTVFSLHNGTISVSDTGDSGTTMTIRLPHE